ncbi:hypothetical protein D3C80_2092970 [compost metagenome]
MGPVKRSGHKILIRHLLELVPLELVLGNLRFREEREADNVIEQEQRDQHLPLLHLQQKQQQGVR